MGVALRRDPAAADEHAADEARRGAAEREARGPGGSLLARLRGSTLPLDRSQVLVGLLLGIAVTARLPLVLAAPFFVMVGGGGSRLRRTVSAGPARRSRSRPCSPTRGSRPDRSSTPGYDYQYRLEAERYPTLGYHLDWGVEDPRYVPQNLGIMLGALPAVLHDVMPNTLGIEPDVPVCRQPGQARSLFGAACPLAVPRDIGTSLLVRRRRCCSRCSASARRVGRGSRWGRPRPSR